MKKIFNIETIAVFLLMGYVFLPPVQLTGYALRIPFIALPIFVIYILIKYKHLNLAIWWQVSSITCIGLLILASTLWSYSFLNASYSIGDLTQTLRYIQFIPYLLIIKHLDESKYNFAVSKITFLSSIIIITISLLQISSPEGIGKTITNLYTTNEGHIDAMSGFNSRILLTGTDPNTGAVIAAYYIFYYLTKYFEFRRYYYLIPSSIFIVLLILTQSRTALISLSVSFVTYILINPNQTIKYKTILLTSLTVVSFFAYQILLSTNLSYLMEGMEFALKGENQSLNVRLENIENATEYFLTSPIFGWGPSGAIQYAPVDSEYALLIQQYGSLGVLAFGSYIYIYIRSSLQALKACNEIQPMSRIQIKCATLFIIYSLVTMTTNNIFSGFQILNILILLSIGTKLSMSNKNNLKYKNHSQHLIN